MSMGDPITNGVKFLPRVGRLLAGASFSYE